jgi:hypothetical protein
MSIASRFIPGADMPHLWSGMDIVAAPINISSRRDEECYTTLAFLSGSSSSSPAMPADKKGGDANE